MTTYMDVINTVNQFKIPESQLETWSNIGAQKTSALTYQAVSNCLASYNWRNNEPEVFLQGSYGNDTNTYGSSDVDIVVLYKSTYQADITALPPQGKQLYEQGFSQASYLFDDFRTDVLSALKKTFGTSVSEEKRCLKVKGDNGRQPADVLPCILYKKYISLTSYNENYMEGVTFYIPKESRWAVNFPKLHLANGSLKNSNERTKGQYKKIVRVFKNARTYLIDKEIISKDLASSYFLECMLFNVPDSYFTTNLQYSFKEILRFLLVAFANNTEEHFISQDCQSKLFANFTHGYWPKADAITLIVALANLGRNWST